MAKMMKLYRLDLRVAKGLNIAQFNPTCKAILKAMYKMEKAVDSDKFPGWTGEQILEFAVENGLWSTRQEPSKYHTTWAYYVKKLKNEAGVTESGSTRAQTTEEYLESDEELLDDEPEDLEEEIEEEPVMQAAE